MRYLEGVAMVMWASAYIIVKTLWGAAKNPLTHILALAGISVVLFIEILKVVKII